MKKQLLLILGSAILGSVSAQISPGNLYSLKYDFQGLIDNYTKVTVDANFAPSGSVTWGLVETIDVTRDGNNLITATQVTSTYPVEILKATASKSGNVYISLVQKQYANGYKNYQRETIFSDGTKDTAYMRETYDTITATYKKADLYSITYNSSGKYTGAIQYGVTGTNWVIVGKEEITYNGNIYNTDTNYTFNGTIWTPKSYVKYFYTSNILDSSVEFINNSGTYSISNMYGYDADINGKVNVLIAYQKNSSNVYLPNTRSTFGMGGSTSGFKELKKEILFSAYPNPAKNNFCIVTNSYKNFQIEVMNLSGQKIAELNSDGASEIDCSAWKNGLYILKITSEDKVVSFQKMVIQN